VANQCLVLRGWNWSAYLAPERQEELPSVEEEDVGIDVGVLSRRLSSAGRAPRFSSVVFRQGDRATTHESVESADLTVADLLRVAETAKFAGRIIERLTIGVEGGRRIRCDFRSQLAGGQTNATFDLATLILNVLPVLIDLNRGQWRTLRRLLSAQDSLTLFDFEDVPTDS